MDYNNSNREGAMFTIGHGTCTIMFLKVNVRFGYCLAFCLLTMALPVAKV